MSITTTIILILILGLLVSALPLTAACVVSGRISRRERGE